MRFCPVGGGVLGVAGVGCWVQGKRFAPACCDCPSIRVSAAAQLSRLKGYVLCQSRGGTSGFRMSGCERPCVC